MHQLSLASLLATILLLSITFAAPNKVQRRSFKIHQKRHDLTGSRSGAMAMERAYRKFGFPPPKTSSARESDASRTKRNSVKERALERKLAVSKIEASAQEADSEFLSPITIGGQTVNLDFDTGSADTYVHLVLEFSDLLVKLTFVFSQMGLQYTAASFLDSWPDFVRSFKISDVQTSRRGQLQDLVWRQVEGGWHCRNRYCQYRGCCGQQPGRRTCLGHHRLLR